jgi:molecular chaperone HtpG
VSEGATGYEIRKAKKEGWGTTVVMYLKKDEEEETYGEFLETYRIEELIKKYSDFIRYPITMDVEETQVGEGKEKKKEKIYITKTLNSMTPLWKKNKDEVSADEYNEYYKSTFYAYDNPLRVIRAKAEGVVDYTALLFIPAKAPHNYYSKGYEKGLKLYTNDVMIAERAADLLPDYFSFVKGVVESDLTLNISRETVQQNHRLKKIAAGLEKKIKAELTDMLENDRETYEKFFAEFGLQIKYGIYENWGMNKEQLQDFVLFPSLNREKKITLKEYADAKKEGQKYIYYAAGKTAEAVKASPQAEKITEAGYDILCFTEEVDEFAAKFMGAYGEMEFKSVSDEDLGTSDAAEETEKDKELIAFIQESLGDKVAKVKLSARLKNHAVCLTAEGELSIEMERVLKTMPGARGVNAQKVLEINASHPLYAKLLSLFDTDKETLKIYADVLLEQAMLMEGLSLDNPADFAKKVSLLLSK